MFFKEKIKERLAVILSLDAHPAHISAGFAVGVFISFTPPVPGLHTLLAIVCAFVFRLNKLTCITGAWVNTYITVIPSMIMSYKLGAYILGIEGEFSLNSVDWASLKRLLLHDGAPLMLGCSIIGFIAAVISYFLCYRLVVAFRSKDAAMSELTREMEVVGEELE